MANNLKWLSKFHLLLLDEVDSTNSEAQRIALSDRSPSYLVITSKKQTNGRGRSGRTWESPHGNLYMSVIVPKTATLDEMSQLTFVSSLALENAISSLFHSEGMNTKIELKWPNDVMINDKKVAGILLESAGKNMEYIVIGVGVNISKAPEIKDKPSTSLQAEGLTKLESTEMLNRFMSNFLKLYQTWLSEEFRGIREKWLKKARNIGKIISVDSGGTRISGKFMDIDFKGQLRVQVASGQIHSINTGEVVFSN